jgi:Calcineurin-like phosphoesterase/Purple acid Phosphatase, N-terminal domain
MTPEPRAMTPEPKPFSRRQLLKGAGGGGIAVALVPVLRQSHGALDRLASFEPATSTSPDGTPEQVHLTWGEDPTASVVVSWASPGPATGARLLLSAGKGRTRAVPAVQRTYTDGVNGETVFTYHAFVAGLEPGSQHSYVVTAENDANAGGPFSGSFQTAPRGRAPFRFTSFGDLATPNSEWVLSYGQSTYAVDAVESFQPLFHLLNGDLCYANLNPGSQPEVWRDFGNNNQRSAANRPWMPCTGNHEIEFNNGAQGLTSYLTRYMLPYNGSGAFYGHWYTFRVGNALFVSLDADDVIYQDGAAFVAGPSALVPASATGNPPIQPGTSFYVRGYSGGLQTAWLQRVLSRARSDETIDWIVVQMHQDALTSSITGNGSDLGIREAWLPLFDQYQVDLVVCGHDHDYERSFPVRGYDSNVGVEEATGQTVDTRRPHPVTTTDTGTFDTSEGTVFLVLGGGGTNANLDDYGLDQADGLPQAKVFTQPNRPVETSTPGVWARAAADAREDAIWSAKRDPATGYGIGVFDVDPGSVRGGETSISVSYYHAPGADPTNPNTGATGTPNPNYSQFEQFTLVRPRSDRGRGRRP